MNQQKFELLLQAVSKTTKDLLIAKGADYASDEDRLSNFKSEARELGVHPLTVWSIYASKHLTAIKSYVRRAEEQSRWLEPAAVVFNLDSKASEPIDGRFCDAINYLFLGLALVKEMRDNPEEFARYAESAQLVATQQETQQSKP